MLGSYDRLSLLNSHAPVSRGGPGPLTLPLAPFGASPTPSRDRGDVPVGGGMAVSGKEVEWSWVERL